MINYYPPLTATLRLLSAVKEKFTQKCKLCDHLLMLFPNLYEFMSYIEHKRDILMNVGYQTVDSSTFRRRNRKIT